MCDDEPTVYHILSARCDGYFYMCNIGLNVMLYFCVCQLYLQIRQSCENMAFKEYVLIITDVFATEVQFTL